MRPCVGKLGFNLLLCLMYRVWWTCEFHKIFQLTYTILFPPSCFGSWQGHLQGVLMYWSQLPSSCIVVVIVYKIIMWLKTLVVLLLMFFKLLNHNKDCDTTRWKLTSVHEHSLKMALSWAETRWRKENCVCKLENLVEFIGFNLSSLLFWILYVRGVCPCVMGSRSLVLLRVILTAFFFWDFRLIRVGHDFRPISIRTSLNS
jgi:hypothetical protein